MTIDALSLLAALLPFAMLLPVVVLWPGKTATLRLRPGRRPSRIVTSAIDLAA